MMNGCREIELELVAYSSGELDPTERDMVRRHLDDCSACREELGREMEIRQALGTLPIHAAPADLENRIKAATVQPAAGWARIGNRRRFTAALALAAASLAIALLVPALRPAQVPNQDWTEAEIAAARQEVMYTLSLAAKVIDRTEKSAVVDVFVDKLPRAINDSFKTVKPTTSGGNG
jgi:anti-sigma factor RsiW